MIRGISFEQTHHKLKFVLSHYDWTEILRLLALFRRAARGLGRATTNRGTSTLSACLLVVLFEPSSVTLVHGVRFGLETPADRLFGRVGEALDGESLEFAQRVDFLVVCDNSLRVGCRDERVGGWRWRREGLPTGARGRSSGR